MKVIRAAVGERERRFIPNHSSGVAFRKQGESPATIEGYGALFNDETVIGMYFRERILPGAFAESIANGDIRVFYNHDANFILGRTSAGTATIEEDATGLRYVATPPATRADVVESIQRKDVTGSSFSFTVESPDDEEWDYRETKNGMLPLRTIKRATLFETGPVAFPAYEHTTVSARAMGKVDAATIAAARAAGDDEPAEEQAELIVYRGLDTLLAQLATLHASAAAIVAALIADETETPTESPDEEAAEDDIEDARLSVLLALTAQMRGVLSGIESLAVQAQADEEDDDPSATSVETLDVLEREIALLDLEG